MEKQYKIVFLLGVVMIFLAVNTAVFAQTPDTLWTTTYDMGWEIEISPDTLRNWISATIDIAVDRKENPHIVNGAHHNQDILRYWYKESDFWNHYDIDSMGVSLAAISVDSMDFPHIIYRKGNQSYLIYAYNEGTQWLYDTVDYIESICGFQNCLKHDVQNKPHIVYQEKGYPYRLKYAYKQNGDWVIEIADTIFNSGCDISMMIDQAGNPYISHWANHNGTFYEKYSYRNGATWNNLIIDTVSNMNIISSGITLDDNNYPHIAYQTHEALIPELRYAYWDGFQWSVETVDNNIDPFGGCDVSMVFDASYNPHIVYGSEFNPAGGDSELRYVHKDGSGSWAVEVVDTIGDCGELNSLAIDSSGYLHIAYFRGESGTNLGQLVYAKSLEPVGIEESQTTAPNPPLVILEVFPNPFNDRTNIRFQIADMSNKAECVELKIYNVTGRLVKNFPCFTPNALRPTLISWDGRDNSGKKVPTGVYFLKFAVSPVGTMGSGGKAGNYKTTRKLLIIK